VNKIDISSLFISKDSTLRQVIACIDKSGLGISLVVDDNQRLLGTITDGDIRRAILTGDAMEAQIQRILDQKSATFYPKAVTAPQSTSKGEILELMKKWVLRHVPLLDDEGRVVDLVTMDDLLPSQKPSLQAVVLAGGEQTRLHPLAADLPRPMLPIGNRPLMEYTINQLREAGISDVSLSTHYKANAVVDYFKDGSDFGVHISYLDENEPSGSAGGLRLLQKKDIPLLVINGDVLTRVDYRAMLAYHQEQQAEMTVAVRLHDFQLPYGVIEAQDGNITGIIEKPAFQRFINAGAYLLNPDLLTFIPEDQPYDMTELINKLLQVGKRVVSFPIHEYWRDIQGYNDYKQAVVDVKNGLFSDLALEVARMEPGAPPPAGFVPLCVPELHGNEWAYIKECLDTNWVSSVGSFVDRFEQVLAEFSGNKYAVAASSGTAALHTALMVAGIQPGDEVILSALTFIAPANAIRYAGAWPVFIDAEPDYWQMDPKKLAQFLEQGCRLEGRTLINLATGRPLRAIMPVHVLGHPCKMDEIIALARNYNLVIIEDATESLGAKFLDQKVGHIGDIACFSFNGNKLITTGGGGMIVTDNEAWAKKAKYLTTQAKDDPLEYIHKEVGYNYRLTNILAALGCAQMEQVVDYIAVKRQIARRYEQALANVPGLTLMKEAPWATSVFWLYTVLVDEKEYGMDSRALLRKIGGAGIQARPLWQPLHLSTVFKTSPKMDAPIAEWLNQTAISLPCSVGLTEKEQDRVIEAIVNERERKT
jgi:perosamine synthetase